MNIGFSPPPLLPCLAWLAALLVAASASAAAAEPGQLLFADDFHGRLAEGWSWVREDPLNWRVTPSGLEIRVQPGGLWGGGNNARNVLVRPLPPGGAAPLEISATFTNTPSNRWEQSDLAWYYDDANMVKLGQELVADRLTVVMGREENDRTRTIAIVPLDDFTVSLRLQSAGNRIRGQFRTRFRDEWMDIGECDLPATGQPNASLHCYNGAPGLEHWSRATGFAIRCLLPGSAAAWSRQKVEEQAAGGQATGTAPRAPGRIDLGNGFSLLNAVQPPSPPNAAQPPFDQAIYRHADGSFGWSWELRTPGHPEPNRPGVAFRPAEFPLAMEGLQTFAAELDIIPRLNVDRPNHRVVLEAVFSGSPAARMAVCFDWYGKDWTGQPIGDCHREYAFDPSASSPARAFYRLQGLRGVPPRIDLKPLLLDSLQRLGLPAASTCVSEVWLGNEVWDRSSGATLVTKCDLLVNGRRYSAVRRP